MTQTYKNYGVLMGYRPTDYVAGALPLEERNPSGDWTQYVPEGEMQKTNHVDSMACVSFSALNSIETQIKFLTGEKKNFSDRFTAKMSGTTPQGNYLYKVADSIRKDGLVDEEDWATSDTFDWAQYYADIPQAVKDKGIRFLYDWDIKDEDIPFDRASLKKHLVHAPIQVVIPGHAILCINSLKDVDKIFDSYSPYLKTVPGGYAGPIVYAKKIVLYKKDVAIPDAHLLVDIKYLDTGKQVQKLINALVANGWVECKDWHDVYDQRLTDYVFRFQKANLSRFSWEWLWALFVDKGRKVGPGTREILNKKLL